MSLTTFLVEDSPLIRAALIPALEDLALATIAGMATSEVDAIAWLETHEAEWQLAVIDLFLEQGSGLQVIHWCRNRSKWQRVVMLTNFADATTRASALTLGADAVFDKSTDLDAFFSFCTSITSREA